MVSLWTAYASTSQTVCREGRYSSFFFLLLTSPSMQLIRRATQYTNLNLQIGVYLLQKEGLPITHLDVVIMSDAVSVSKCLLSISVLISRGPLITSLWTAIHPSMDDTLRSTEVILFCGKES